MLKSIEINKIKECDVLLGDYGNRLDLIRILRVFWEVIFML